MKFTDERLIEIAKGVGVEILSVKSGVWKWRDSNQIEIISHRDFLCARLATKLRERADNLAKAWDECNPNSWNTNRGAELSRVADARKLAADLEQIFVAFIILICTRPIISQLKEKP